MSNELLSLLNKAKELKRAARKPRTDKGIARGKQDNPHIGSRATRSDKGLKRGKQLNPLTERTTVYSQRNDKGSAHKPIYRSPVSLFFREFNYLLNTVYSPLQPDWQVRFDYNGYFKLAIKTGEKIDKTKSIIVNGQKYTRQSISTGSKTLDLEAYRFRALQESIDLPLPEQWDVLNEMPGYEPPDWYGSFDRLELRTTPVLDYFSTFYHIPDYAAMKWSYEKWRKVYDSYLCSHDAIALPKDLWFEFDEDYMTPEYVEFRSRQLQDSWPYKVAKSDAERRVTAKYSEPIKRQIISEHPELSMQSITRRVNAQLPYDKINEEVKQIMCDWTREQLEGEK